MTARPCITIFGLEADQSIKHTAKAAVKAGYAVIPVEVGGKAPICTLNTTERRALKGKDHQCGVYHAITDVDVAEKVFKRLGEKGVRHNLGIVAGPSKVITVDCDTADEILAFQSDWAAIDGAGYLGYSPTVLSPGLEENGVWIHKDGGHFHFIYPEGMDPFPWDVKGSMKMPGGYDVRWGMVQSLVPPSVRKEGPYIPTGDILPAPDWLLDKIRDYLALVAERRLDRAARTADDDVAAWSMATSWEALLSVHGWDRTGKLDRCGCDQWTKPGGGTTSPKSATAHESDCIRYDNIEGHGPLHLWTTDPPAELLPYVEAGTQTLTKLMFVAAMRYGGDIAAAKVGEGISPDVSDWFDSVPEGDGVTATSEESVTPRHLEQDQRVTGDDSPGVVTPSPSSQDDSEAETDSEPGRHPRHPRTVADAVKKAMEMHGVEDEEYERTILMDDGKTITKTVRRSDDVAKKTKEMLFAQIARTAADIHLGNIRVGDRDQWKPDQGYVERFVGSATEPPQTVLVKTDNKCVFNKARTNNITGARGSGKTMLAAHTTAQVMEAGGRVLYYDMEDTMGAFRERLMMMGCDADSHARAGRLEYVNLGPLPAGGDLDRMIDYAGGFDLVVFDTMNKLISRKGGDIASGNSEIVWLYDNLFNPIAGGGACVIYLDHPAKRGQRMDADVADMDPVGGAMKLNDISGHAIAMRVVKHFTRSDPAGEVHLISLKDRTGHYQQGEAVGTFRGELDVPGDRIGFQLRVDPPGPEAAPPSLRDDVDAAKARILTILREVGKPMNPSVVRKNVTARIRPLFEVAAEELIAEESITVTDDGKYELKEGDG